MEGCPPSIPFTASSARQQLARQHPLRSLSLRHRPLQLPPLTVRRPQRKTVSSLPHGAVDAAGVASVAVIEEASVVVSVAERGVVVANTEADEDSVAVTVVGSAGEAVNGGVVRANIVVVEGDVVAVSHISLSSQVT